VNLGDTCSGGAGATLSETAASHPASLATWPGVELRPKFSNDDVACDEVVGDPEVRRSLRQATAGTPVAKRGNMAPEKTRAGQEAAEHTRRDPPARRETRSHTGQNTRGDTPSPPRHSRTPPQ